MICKGMDFVKTVKYLRAFSGNTKSELKLRREL
jgi:hypothetical protein